MRSLALWYALPGLLLLVALGVAGDMVGVAAAAADAAALHAMASWWMPGARTALALKRNAAQVTSICGDIVGDVAGTVSGAAAAAVAGRLAAAAVAGAAVTGAAAAGGHGAAAALPAWAPAAAEAAAVAVVAALTVGGKAFGKGIALERANEILYGIGYFAHACERVLPRRWRDARRDSEGRPLARQGAGDARGADGARRGNARGGRRPGRPGASGAAAGGNGANGGPRRNRRRGR